MNIYEATARMREIVEAEAEKFKSLPLFVHIEEFYSDARLGATSEEKAKYISITLVLSTVAPDDEETGVEHRIGIGVEVKSKKVTEEELEEARVDFENETAAALERLCGAEACADELAALEQEADERYRAIVEEYKKSLPKKMFLLIGAVIVAVGLIVIATVL